MGEGSRTAGRRPSAASQYGKAAAGYHDAALGNKRPAAALNRRENIVAVQKIFVRQIERGSHDVAGV